MLRDRLNDVIEESSDVGRFNLGALGTTDDVSSVTLRPKMDLDCDRESSNTDEHEAPF